MCIAFPEFSGFRPVGDALAFLPEEAGKAALGIQIGVPFWRSPSESRRVLHLDNQGDDPLSSARMGPLLKAAFHGTTRLIGSWLTGAEFNSARDFHVTGHEYEWPQLRPAVEEFLKRNLRP